MPQLDKLSYSTQIFWLLILFTSFYFFILKHILPKLLLNLKVRYKKINSISLGRQNIIAEAIVVYSNYLLANGTIVSQVADSLDVSKNLMSESWAYRKAEFANSELIMDAIELNEDFIVSLKLNTSLKEND